MTCNETQKRARAVGRVKGVTEVDIKMRKRRATGAGCALRKSILDNGKSFCVLLLLCVLCIFVAGGVQGRTEYGYRKPEVLERGAGAYDEELSREVLERGAGAYDEELSRIFILLSAITYCHVDAIESWSCKGCNLLAMNDVSVFKTYAMKLAPIFCYVGVLNENSIIVAFKGTATTSDWIVDLDFYRTAPYNDTIEACESCLVHSGFKDAWDDVKSKILPKIRELMTQITEPRIHITGHSLGGAIATLCAAELELVHDFPVESAFTYGSPRVGNKNFANWYNASTTPHWRITHYTDLVPHVPFTPGYFHVAREVYYSQNSSSFIVCDGSGEDPLCSRQYPLYRCSIEYHLKYLEIDIGEDSWVCDAGNASTTGNEIAVMRR